MFATNLRAKLWQKYYRFERYISVFSFGLGVLWDILSIGRIDQWANIVQLGVYISIVILLILDEMVVPTIRFGENLANDQDLANNSVRPRRSLKFWINKARGYREEVAHFFLGSLLSAFAIFFIKSSSFWGSLGFFVLIIAGLIGNEFSGVRRLGLVVRAILTSLCLVSFLSCITPLLFGQIGPWPFAVAVIAAVLLIGLLYAVAEFAFKTDGHTLEGFVAPSLVTIAIFVVFYVAQLIPPVPVALTEIGVYRSVERSRQGYIVGFMADTWKFWYRGDQEFLARKGDRVYIYFSVFSPAGFKETVQIRWLRDDEDKGWQTTDLMPLKVSGGRIEGYRGFVFKSQYTPGDWQVRIETSDGREIGRINIDIEQDLESTPRRVNYKTL